MAIVAMFRFGPKELEKVILKTIAAFMNAEGGKLIIGVDDKGNILGIENDLQTLKQKDKDGFEQLIIQLISKQWSIFQLIGKKFYYEPISKELA